MNAWTENTAYLFLFVLSAPADKRDVSDLEIIFKDDIYSCIASPLTARYDRGGTMDRIILRRVELASLQFTMPKIRFSEFGRG